MITYIQYIGLMVKKLPDYELSGTLTEGTSTITVSYNGKTTTFNNAMPGYYIYSYDEPISDLIPTYKLVECSSEGEILSTVYIYYLGQRK